MKTNKEKVQIAMAKACITAGELKEVSGACPAAVNKVINGNGEIRPATLGRVAKALGVSPDELL